MSLKRVLRATVIAAFMAAVLGAALAQARPVSPGSLAASTAANTAPKVSKQPASVTVEAGQVASFVTASSGVPTPSVQWQISIDGGASWTAIEGATASTLTIASSKTSETGDQLRAVFKNVAGEATSKAAVLTVQQAPAVTSQPLSSTVEEGQSATFEAAASGSPAPTVKWESSSNGGSSWTAVSGATSNRLTIAAVKTTLSGHQYRASFKNVVGTATSEAALLSVQNPPILAKQPAGATVDEGQSATFEASASGFPTPSVRWEVSSDGGLSWNPVEGASSDLLTIADALVAEDGHRYRAVFTNAAGTVTSQAAELNVRAVPVLTRQPASTTVEAGEGASFEAAASGYPTPTVQWELSTNGGGAWSAVPGATSDLLTLERSQISESGDQYRAVFTNLAGRSTSSVAVLTVASNHFSAVGWGQNLYRQLGDGFKEQSSDAPVPVTGLKYVSAVAAGERHSLALLANGTVVAWGSNGFGQLGDGSMSESSVPVAVHNLSGVTAIAAGASHSLALLSNGTLMAWGDNESGQLGIASATEDSELPVPVKGLSGVKAISAGANYSLALLSNGTVMAWGDNSSGQLGTGSTASSNTPVAVKHLSGVAAVAAGGEFSLALLSNGTVESWGSDERGQLDNSTLEEESSDVPVTAEELSGVTAIAAGTNHALALLHGGTVVGWGDDSSGELGNGTVKAFEEAPVAVSGLSGVSMISAGGQDSVALLSSGSVMSWGSNASGLLGDGMASGESDVPTPVLGLSKVASISAGRLDTLAYGEPIPTVSSVTPPVGPAAGANTVTIAGNTFTGATAVKFGSAPASAFTVNSATSITATVPPGHGTVDITVVTPSGTSPAGAADRYTYQLAPTVTKLSAKSGAAIGGTTVTITGTELTAATNVGFGPNSATSFTVNSTTSITAIAPPATVAGAVDITVSNSAGTSAASSKDRFTYLPTVEGVTPDAGSVLGGASVTVTGSGFALGSTATAFKFGTVKAKSVTCASSTACVMIAPAQGAGSVDVRATVNKASSPIDAPADRFAYS